LFQKYFASIRLAFALVCVGASLILAAQWLGFVPDAAKLEMRARRDLSETIAITATNQIRNKQWVDLERNLQAIVDHHPTLLSIGVRSNMGTLRVDTGHHAGIWPEVISMDDLSLQNPENLVINEQKSVGVETAFVPIHLNRRSWGRVEYCFHQPITSTLGRILAQPLLRLVSFFIVAGIFSYTLFVARMLGVFSSTQVVPDRVRQALDTLAEGLLVLDEAGKIVLANQAFAGIVGKPAEELENKLADDLDWIQEDLDEIGSSPWSLAIQKSILQSERMLRYQLTDGTERIFSVNAAPLGKGKSGRGALATFRDVTHVEEHRIELERMLNLLEHSRDEINRKNEELQILATRDSLTGCLNRRAFFEEFEMIWDTAKNEGKYLSCIMIDIDHFKSVNDTYGHHIGDEVLREVSKVVRNLFQEFGLVCRYGGEEFCVLLPQHHSEQAVMESEKIREAIGKVRFSDPEELRLTASLGVSELRFNAAEPQDLINQADACLYVAKRGGRNQTVLFNNSMIVDEDEVLEEPIKVSRVEIPYKAVTALMSALSFRDTKTAEHSRRVSDLCARASEGLMDVSDRYVLEVAGLLHDIGKIGVPDHILFKPGSLTPEEWEIMGRHDDIGVEIVTGGFDCPELSSIMANHHAFFDGNGRETDLPTGQDIPVGARLLSIADSYDAMVSDRPYRKGRSHAEAISELRSCAGTQFDPELVEHFIQKISAAIPETASGAMAIRKLAAIEIGTQIERLASAINTSDVEQIHELSTSLTDMADSIGLSSISKAARDLSDQDQELATSTELLRQARDLVDTCRSTQSNFLRLSLESQADQTEIPT
jgi:diguanylate cyclase (GGDEF)-like protein/PAS domain S-box-containing protein/putative nucleotidyltransferase with HDIG domain